LDGGERIVIGRITPVSFLNKNGQRLFGMFHQPDRAQAADVAIILLSPGVKMRVAPHRLYNKMADRFVALGYPVLRFDFFGLGDSEGTVDEVLLADLYGAIQVGRYVDDTIAAMDWMQQTHGTGRFIMAGLCGGAITGLLARVKDERISGLLSLAIPVILDGSTIDVTKYMTVPQFQWTRQGYLRRFKLWRPEVWKSWLRFVTLQSDYRLIIRSVMTPLWSRLRRTATGQTSDQVAETKDNTNPYFAPAFMKMVSTSRPVLLIFAKSDRLYWEFEAKFMNRYRSEVEAYAEFYEIHVTEQSNHIFSFPECQADMLERSCRWLGRYFPAQSPEAAGEDREQVVR
jgi:alpha/beta superfamily hydrolase